MKSIITKSAHRSESIQLLLTHQTAVESKAKTVSSEPETLTSPCHVLSKHGIYLVVDQGLPLNKVLLEGCTIFANRALMVEDMYFDPLQNYSSKEDADAVIYLITESNRTNEIVLVDDRGIAAPLGSSIEDFLNTYKL